MYSFFLDEVVHHVLEFHHPAKQLLSTHLFFTWNSANRLSQLLEVIFDIFFQVLQICSQNLKLAFNELVNGCFNNGYDLFVFG